MYVVLWKNADIAVMNGSIRVKQSSILHALNAYGA